MKRRYTTMHKRRVIISGLAIIASCTAMSFARVALKSDSGDINLGISGTTWMENGQFVMFFNKGAEKSHQWINRTFVNLGIDAIYKERFKVDLGIEGKMWLNIPKGGGTGQAVYNHRLNSTFIVDRACGTYFIGEPESPLLAVSVGRFPFKYNPDVKNLGEYLFRSGTYPAYLINNFDLPFARLTGFKLSSTLNSMVHQDLLLTFETDIPPYYDASLTYIGDCSIGNFLDVGAGVQFAHLISVDKNQTTPKVIQGSSSPSTRNFYKTTSGDSGFYTFRGTKLMGRLSLDPIGFLSKAGILPNNLFGKEDGKIYVEAAILGVKNYPKNDSTPAGTTSYSGQKNGWGYDNILNKMPVTIGLNIPTCKLLDIFAVEVEWYGCTYPNNFANELGQGPSQSYPLPDNGPYFNYNADNWKWSVYAKKMFLNDHFGIVAQVARDHIRTETIVDEGADLEQALRNQKHLWWISKFVAAF